MRGPLYLYHHTESVVFKFQLPSALLPSLVIIPNPAGPGDLCFLAVSYIEPDVAVL